MLAHWLWSHPHPSAATKLYGGVYKHSVIRARKVFFNFLKIYFILFFAGATFIRQYSQPIMRQQHIMQRHSHYATTLSAKHVTAAYHAMQHSQSCNGSISCSSTLIMQQEHIMQRHSHYATAAMQHSQSCNGILSCSSILNAIALSHYEFFILLLPAIYA